MHLISYFTTSNSSHESEWHRRGVRKIQQWGSIYIVLWTVCVLCICMIGSWFLNLITISNMHLIFLSLLQISFVSSNGKDQRLIKDSMGVLFFLFAWISCVMCVWTRRPWFSHLKAIPSCTWFFISLLQILFMSWNGIDQGSVKYSKGVLYILLSRISCVKSVHTRGPWYSHLKTIPSCTWFFIRLLQILFMSWSGKD